MENNNRTEANKTREYRDMHCEACGKVTSHIESNGMWGCNHCLVNEYKQYIASTLPEVCEELIRYFAGEENNEND